MKTLDNKRNRVLMAMALFLGLGAVPFFAPPFYVVFLNDALIIACLSMSLNLLVGYTGLISFGHAAYFGLGAYACGLLMKSAGLPFGVSLVAAGALGGFGAALAGFFCVRLNRVYFSMLTLAFSLIFWAICFRWNDLTGGDQGLSGIPYPNLTWISQMLGRPDFSSAQSYYLVSLVVVAICIAAMWIIVSSPVGLMLRTIRENEQRSTFIGVETRRVKLAIFIVAGTIAGLAGGLFAIFNRGVYPDFMYWTKSAEILIMALFGGIGSFWGPAIGSLTLLLLHQETLAFTEYWSFALGIILLVLTLRFPSGLWGLFKRFTNTRRSK